MQIAVSLTENYNLKTIHYETFNTHIVGDTAKWHTPTFRVRMIFRDNRV